MIVANFPDFQNEEVVLQDTLESRDHILLQPRSSTRSLQVRIECSWGVAKLKFRRKVNDAVPKNLGQNLIASTWRRTILTEEAIRLIAR